jgi:hypothetical protein
MWLLTSVALVAFSANVAAEILAEGVATVAGQVYVDWFWALEPSQTMAHASIRYNEVDAMIDRARSSVERP